MKSILIKSLILISVPILAKASIGENTYKASFWGTKFKVGDVVLSKECGFDYKKAVISEITKSKKIRFSYDVWSTNSACGDDYVESPKMEHYIQQSSYETLKVGDAILSLNCGSDAKKGVIVDLTETGKVQVKYEKESSQFTCGNHYADSSEIETL